MKQGTAKTEGTEGYRVVRPFWEQHFSSKFKKGLEVSKFPCHSSEKIMHYLPSFDPHTVGSAQQRGFLNEDIRDMGPRVVCS
jgi:hypothetical protein